MIAVVTGAGRGIGRATAIELARRGADIALLARTKAELDETTARVEETGRRARAVVCDVARGEAVAYAAAEVERELGTASIVVANAGIVHRALVVDMDESDWDRVLDVNLKGIFLVARAFLPGMVDQRRGRFIAIGSISSTVGTARQSAYCAAKWGAVGFVKSLAEELRGSGVQAMTVLPGSVDTSMLRGSGFAPQMSAEDVARLVAFAAFDAPDAMNGSALEMFGP